MDAAHELIWGYSYGAVTIEAICERAGVRKGSFYYFFDSKSDLAVAAISSWWIERKAMVEELNRAEASPIERLCKYLDFVVERQSRSFEETGKILGCPVFSLGSEICTQDERIRSLIQEILAYGARWFEEAVRDAQRCGEAEEGNAAIQGRLLWAFYEGTLTRARIENDVELLRNLTSDALELIGARRSNMAEMV
jgi:TetR/AcrR family transcriptional repressor of nem operon